MSSVESGAIGTGHSIPDPLSATTPYLRPYLCPGPSAGMLRGGHGTRKDQDQAVPLAAAGGVTGEPHSGQTPLVLPVRLYPHV